MIDWFDHDNEDDRPKAPVYDDSPELCDFCGGPRNAHLDNPPDGCETCAICLSAQLLVDACDQDLTDAKDACDAATLRLKLATDRLVDAERNMDDAEIKLKLRKAKK